MGELPVMCVDHPPSRRWNFIPTPGTPSSAGWTLVTCFRGEAEGEGRSPRVSRAVGAHPDSCRCPRDRGFRGQPHSLALGGQQHGQGIMRPLAPGTW